ncbi:AEC family transporter [Paracrocinitomix mangrovi]|nr:AEC family transporter [Paracrocinitomix mangrovi]
MATRLKFLNQNRIQFANKWIIFVALPAVALVNVPGLQVSQDLLVPALSPIIVFFGAFILFRIVLRNKLETDQGIALTILGGLGNTSFVGFPVITVLFGAEYLSYALIADQVNFLLLATAAQFIISAHSGGFNIKKALKKVALFPPFIALIVALFIPFKIEHDLVSPVLEALAYTVSPVAMLVVGYQIAKYVDFKFTSNIILGISYKLVLAPILVYLAFIMMDTEKVIFDVSVMESAMGPMVSGAILLMDEEIQPKLTAQVLCWGIILSSFTLFVWSLLL